MPSLKEFANLPLMRPAFSTSRIAGCEGANERVQHDLEKATIAGSLEPKNSLSADNSTVSKDWAYLLIEIRSDVSNIHLVTSIRFYSCGIYRGVLYRASKRHHRAWRGLIPYTEVHVVHSIFTIKALYTLNTIRKFPWDHRG